MSDEQAWVRREWCEECRRPREVVDDHVEVSLESGYMSRTTNEHEYHVLDFSCGHSKVRDTGRVTGYRDAP